MRAFLVSLLTKAYGSLCAYLWISQHYQTHHDVSEPCVLPHHDVCHRLPATETQLQADVVDMNKVCTC